MGSIGVEDKILIDLLLLSGWVLSMLKIPRLMISFISQVQNDHMMDVSRPKSYRTRKHVNKMIGGSYEEQFATMYN